MREAARRQQALFGRLETGTSNDDNKRARPNKEGSQRRESSDELVCLGCTWKRTQQTGAGEAKLPRPDRNNVKPIERIDEEEEGKIIDRSV